MKVTRTSLKDEKQGEATKEMCLAIWGNQEMQWLYVPSEGTSGGMICIWDPLCFSVLLPSWGGVPWVGRHLEEERVRGCLSEHLFIL